VVRRDGLTDSDFIADRTEGYGLAEELIEAYDPDAVEEITGIPADDLVAAAHIYGEANAASILWGLGVTEHKYGSEVVQLLCNLAMMTGNIGKAGAALLPLRGQKNVQGSSDMGAPRPQPERPDAQPPLHGGTEDRSERRHAGVRLAGGARRGPRRHGDQGHDRPRLADRQRGLQGPRLEVRRIARVRRRGRQLQRARGQDRSPLRPPSQGRAAAR
jgi:anaerobic selenocysteine-containing dehydrogenase